MENLCVCNAQCFNFSGAEPTFLNIIVRYGHKGNSTMRFPVKLMNLQEKFMNPHRKPQPGACR
ncbi:hypothetical protein L798_00221 [Zootermopsis nevadensis]|uniref:Uncharacterized protein n=1 Tax=Zootermopsis nevadensis TaxID=136037 RepID=A0A067QLK2_ZOONE|nr:hypothetical protein L798_00221 [Zootermopsis nevadensis]